MSKGRFSLAAASAGAFVLLWLIGLGAYPLMESTEGRYGSIAAAMARTGDYLEPRFNGLAHLTKPPLAYWAGALSLRLLSENELALRLPATLALFFSAWVVVKIGRAAGLEGHRARRAGILAGLAPLAVIQGRMLSSDIFLWIGILSVFYGVIAEGESSLRRAFWTGLGLSFGFLAKGHIVLLWVIPPVLAWALIERRWKATAILAHPATLLAFLVTAGPWFLVIVRRHPGLVDFWLKGETADRYLSTVHGRGEPWWYFIVLLPISVLPWLPEAIRGVVRAVRRPGAHRLWLLWAFVPFVLLCFSGSKRPNYLLPLVAPLALLAAAETVKPLRRSAGWRLGVWVALVLVAPFAMRVIPGAVPPTKRLVSSLPMKGADLIAYRVFPTSLEYYWGRPVPLVDVQRPSPFDADSTAALVLLDQEQMAARLEKGGLLLLKEKDAGQVETHLGRRLTQIARDGKLMVVQRPEGSLGYRTPTPATTPATGQSLLGPE